ncbi:hypothetical protein [Rheinheimera sp. MM224]|uniref:hypothetical protein n=1 Tax=Rheinheimera sp. MM224 TaxID=3019969 RepID=UPI0021F864CC|nr:hypothetical protein [Rheinheimera sp. MM224]CAI3795835.1 hypothetical protein JAMGFMIE_01417 [Rheinheimera sp. MM224]
MIKTYGKLSLVDNKWIMTAIPPHVAIRLKHLFPRIPKWQSGEFTFPNDSAHCADLSWFQQRYPMQMSCSDNITLNNGRISFENTQARMEVILRPDYKPADRHGLKEGQQIRQYQGQAIDLTLARLALLLGDDVGLGKTYTTAGLLLEAGTVPAAVVMQTHLL